MRDSELRVGGGCTKNTPALIDIEGVHLRIPTPSERTVVDLIE